MARDSATNLAQLAVLGVAGLVTWEWAKEQPADSPWNQAVQQIRTTFGPKAKTGGAAQPAAPAAPASIPATPSPNQRPVTHPDWRQGGPNDPGWYDVALWDYGGIPLEFNKDEGRLRQRASVGGTNEYSPGETLVQNQWGDTMIWQGGNDLSDGGHVLDYVSIGV